MRYIVLLILNILLLGVPLKGQLSGVGIVPLNRVGMVFNDSLLSGSDIKTASDSLRTVAPTQGKAEISMFTILVTVFRQTQIESKDPLVKLMQFILVKTFYYEYRKR